MTAVTIAFQDGSILKGESSDLALDAVASGQTSFLRIEVEGVEHLLNLATAVTIGVG